ncbi:MAG: hypothetical protein PVI57_03040 [Gemmatimonadota bacterium]
MTGRPLVLRALGEGEDLQVLREMLESEQVHATGVSPLIGVCPRPGSHYCT